MTESVFGTWWNPTEPAVRFAGRLVWDPPSAPILEVLDAPTAVAAWSDERIPVLIGEVDRFGWMTLLDCDWWGARWGAGSTRRFRVGQALSRVHCKDPSDQFIRRVEMDVPALALLLGEAPVNPGIWPTSRSKTIHLNVDSRKRTWHSDEVDIEFRYTWRMTQAELSISVAMAPQVYLSSRRSHSFRWWLEKWLVPLSEFLLVATAEPFRARHLKLWVKKNISNLERSNAGIHVWQTAIDPDAEVDFRSRNRREVPPLVNEDELERMPIHDILRRTAVFATRYEVFFGLLAESMVATDRPKRNRYLDVVTAIEAYDSTVQGSGPIGDDRFRKDRAMALDASCDLTATRFLRRWLPRRSFYSLEQRLERTRRSLGLDWARDAQAMAQLRNDIAHGNARPDSVFLDDAFSQGLEAARLLALREMGAGS